MKVNKLMYQVAYTVVKYAEFIDFSKLADENALAFRYLATNILTLKDYYSNLKKEVKNVK